MTHPHPPCIVSLYFTCFHLGLFQDPCAFYTSLVGEAAFAESPLDICLVSHSDIFSFTHCLWTVFRHLSRSICRREDPLRFTFFFTYPEGRPELSLDTLFIISPATATARMTFPPADPVPGLNISPLFKDPNRLFPVQP